jgi:hypothetical protein
MVQIPLGVIGVFVDGVSVLRRIGPSVEGCPPGVLRFISLLGWVAAHRWSHLRRTSNSAVAASSSKMITHAPVTWGSRMISPLLFSLLPGWRSLWDPGAARR